MTRSPNKLIPEDFATVPGLAALEATRISLGDSTSDVDLIAVGVTESGDVPTLIGLGRDALVAAGFEAKPGQTLLLPRASGPDLLAVGLGDASSAAPAELRDTAAAVVRAAASRERVGLSLDLPSDDRSTAITALVEGALLARYRYTELKSDPKHAPLVELAIDDTSEEDRPAVEAARINARAAVVARDLANTPPGHLTATDLGEIAVELGHRFGFDVETFDK
ncbi:MAG: leucyl aminopeptidase, partial [Actinobacteria bacterium]|nr:leucyl aminopeptidase [Actinomycetota bacterium]